MDSTVVGSEQGKRGRPKMYVTDEQIAEQREKRLKHMREYSKEHRERKREYDRERRKKSRELSDDETSEDSDVTFTGDMEYDDYICYRLKIDIVTVNVSAYNNDL